MNKKVTYAIVGVVIVVLILAIVLVMNKSTSEDKEGQKIIPLGKTQAEAAALAANQDWVLDLNSLGRAELYGTSTLENGIWTVQVRNYQRTEDQTGYLLLYKVEADTGVVQVRPQRAEVSA